MIRLKNKNLFRLKKQKRKSPIVPKTGWQKELWWRWSRIDWDRNTIKRRAWSDKSLTSEFKGNHFLTAQRKDGKKRFLFMLYSMINPIACFYCVSFKRTYWID